MANVGDRKYVEKIINSNEARRLRDACSDAASDVSRAGIAIGAIAEIFQVPVGLIVSGSSALLSCDFRRSAQVYNQAYNLLTNGTFVKAKVSQQFEYKKVKNWGDYFFGWYAINSPQIVALQYSNGRWETDPNY